MRLPAAIAAHVADRRTVAIEDGQSGAEVWRFVGADADYFLKVGRGHVATAVAGEAARLGWLAGRAPAPQVVAAVDEADASWLLTSALPGVSAGAWIKADRTRAVTMAETLATFLHCLHALSADDCPFDSSVAALLPIVRRLVADGHVDTEDFDPEHAGWSAAQVLADVEDLAGHARGRVVIHGDFSLGNVIVAGDGTIAGCIDVGRLGVGDPYRDIFIGWRDLGGFGADAQQAFLTTMGVAAWEAPRRDLHRALDELL